MNKSKWIEIRNDFFEETESMDKDTYCFIDAWLTDSDDEKGMVIAKINCGTKEVEYIDEDAKTDSYAQEMINEILILLDEKEKL